jgi:hypothetical protein
MFYKLNARNSLSALVDLFMEWLVFLMYLWTLRNYGNATNWEERNLIVTYWKHGNIEAYHIVCSNGACTCRNFMKMGYCKLLLHVHALLNEENDYIIIDRQFLHKENTKITK